MIKIIRLSEMAEADLDRLMKRSTADIQDVRPVVSKIIQDVRDRGDPALLDYTEELDGVCLDTIRVTRDEIRNAFERTDTGLIERMREQISYSTEFHKRQLRRDWKSEVTEGVTLGERYLPIDSVGLYVPGGRAAYPSVLQILGVAARTAGVPRIAICTPPNSQGNVPDPVLAMARLLDLEEVYKVGGAQAVAALAYGTESIEPVLKIVGPGNIYVNCAKMSVYGTVDIDMPAGPSEALIIADGTADPRFAAADILARCEHDPKASAVLLTCSDVFAGKVAEEIEGQVTGLSRGEIIIQSLANYSAIVVCEDMDDIVDFANEYAAEHLELMVEDPWKLLDRIDNAGSVFLGNYSPVAAGDYASGTNHVLPTGQFARMFSPVGVETFQKRSELQYITEEGLRRLGPVVKAVSDVEGLDGHYRSVEVRL